MEIPLSEFKIIKELGKGAFGVVHLAERKAELFALKSLKLSGELPEGILTEIQHEVKIMLQLRHPNVVLVVAYSFNEPGRYVAMEYLEGGNLRELLSSKTPITTSMQQKYALDIARGMNYLHSLPKPVFHRDLKANNVLVDHSGTLKVSDFGLSTVSSYSASAATAMQPINWCAPELANGEAFTAPCDVYSYAMTLYEILSRELPFQGKSAQEIFFALMQNKRPVVPIGAPTDLGTLMTECWHNQPNQRPTFEAIVQRLRTTTSTSKQDNNFQASSSTQTTASNDAALLEKIKQLELELKIKSQKESEIQTQAEAKKLQEILAYASKDVRSSTGFSFLGGMFSFSKDKPTYNYHVYIAYRRVSDLNLANELYLRLKQQKINGMKVQVFFDQELKPAEEWEPGFLRALDSSLLFVPLLSPGSLALIENPKPGVKDHFLHEIEIALARFENKHSSICPLYVADQSEDRNSYNKLKDLHVDKFPDIPSQTLPTSTIRETMGKLLKIQGMDCLPDNTRSTVSAIVDYLATIHNVKVNKAK